MATSSEMVTINWGNFQAILPWSGWLLLLFFFYFFYKDPDKFDAWMAKLDKLLLRIGLKRERQFIQRDIRSRINSVSKKINREAEGLITKNIDIIWVNQENIESFLRKGKVIVRMQHYENHDKNIVNATIHYVARGVLHTSKIYLPEKMQDALNLSLIKKILVEEKEESTSMDYFFANILKPKLSSDEELNKNFMVIEKMEKKGLFTRILLREIRLMGKKLYPSIPTEQEFKETKDFFNFLELFTHLPVATIKDWVFVRTNIRMGILFVAQKDKLECEGYDPYIKRINEKINLGARYIYLFGRRPNNVKAVKEISKIVRSGNKKIINYRTEKYYSIIREERFPAICIVLKILSK